jgi:hypothetical protein
MGYTIGKHASYRVPFIILYYGLCSSTLIVINKVAVHNLKVQRSSSSSGRLRCRRSCRRQQRARQAKQHVPCRDSSAQLFMHLTSSSFALCCCHYPHPQAPVSILFMQLAFAAVTVKACNICGLLDAEKLRWSLIRPFLLIVAGFLGTL